MRNAQFYLPLAASALLLACTGPGVREPAPVAAATPAIGSLVDSVRAAAEVEDALAVSPLLDPQVADLSEAAHALEAAGRYQDAAEMLQRALQITPDDPALLQHAAEIALHLGELDRAVGLAGRSYEIGPRLGPLCRRNWATVGLVREVQGSPEHAEIARERLARCTVEPPVRM